MFGNYYNPYQIGYQQTPYQPPQPTQQPQQNTQPVDDRIFVANASAADAYLVAPNGFVRLWDSNANRFYEKQADGSGRQYPIVTYEYKRVDAVPAQPSNDFEARLKSIEDRLSAFENREVKTNE